MIWTNHEPTDRRIRELEEENGKLLHAYQDAQQRYRMMFKQSHDIVFLHTLDGVFLEVSDVMADMLGYTYDELKKTNVLDLIGKSQQHIAKASLQELLETGKIEKPTEYKLQCKDGCCVWLEIKESLVCRDSEPYAVQGVARDITKRKEAEKELRESEALYRTIFEHTATANVIVGEDTIIKLVNSNFCKWANCSRDELEGKISWTSFVAPEDLDKMVKNHNQRRTDSAVPTQSYEFTGITRGGEKRCFFLNVAMVPGTTDSIGSFVDITERKRAEERLKQSEERFRNLSRLLPETIFEMDLLGRFSFVHETALKRFGYSEQDFEQGIYLKDIIIPEEFEHALDNIQKIIKGENLGLSEYTLRCKDGSNFIAMIHTICIEDNGKTSGFMGFFVDMTNKK